MGVEGVEVVIGPERFSGVTTFVCLDETTREEECECDRFKVCGGPSDNGPSTGGRRKDA